MYYKSAHIRHPGPHCSLQASPGNFQQFEEILFGNSDMSSSPVVMAIKLGKNGKQTVNFSHCVMTADVGIALFTMCRLWEWPVLIL